MNMNGSLDYDQLYYDSVVMNMTEYITNIYLCRLNKKENEELKEVGHV